MTRIGSLLLICILLPAAVWLMAGGAQLLAAGGSAYYLAAGVALMWTAIALWRQSGQAPTTYAALIWATVIWSLWEVGLDGWALAPRLLALAVLGLPFLTPPLRTLSRDNGRWMSSAILAVTVVMGIASLSALLPTGTSNPRPQEHSTAPDSAATEWRHWGRTVGGTRFVPSRQINTGNVGELELAWRYDSHLPPPMYLSFEATPLFADGRLYVCLKPGIVAALDPDSGEEIWRYTADIAGQLDFTRIFGGKCRGVSYYESPDKGVECPARILFPRPDGYLVAVNAKDGRPCTSFGDSGMVDLHAGVGPMPASARRQIIAMPSSPAVIVNNVAVIGQTISDLESLDAPSGVVRGYDALTGELRWAWDAGRPGQSLLEPGQFYTRNTPNAWGVFSADERLDLVYIPTGNSLPDYYGGSRVDAVEHYSSSVVALDVSSGELRWSFQTVHHDTWDYDVAAQPVVVDLPGENGGIPALLVPTKLGQIFVLDRRSGEPIDKVMEKPVPQAGAVPGERLSSTQPYTTGFPSLAGPDLTEADMWGVSPLDQLWCRLLYRKAHYFGQFTPISTRETIMYPGTAGGINWGSVSVDPHRGLLFVNTLRFANLGRLLPRESAPVGTYGGKEGDAVFEQAGTPYAFVQSTFMSALKVPCQRPPYGTVNVLDLETRSLRWSRSFGTSADIGPLGIPTLLPIRIGAPNMGGSVVTAGGLAFIGAAQDRKLRAYAMDDGSELWSAPLPAVGAASPMSYISPKTGRQYVVIAAGGHYGLPGPPAGAVLAFALPE